MSSRGAGLQTTIKKQNDNENLKQSTSKCDQYKTAKDDKWRPAPGRIKIRNIRSQWGCPLQACIQIMGEENEAPSVLHIGYHWLTELQNTLYDRCTSGGVRRNSFQVRKSIRPQQWNVRKKHGRNINCIKLSYISSVLQYCTHSKVVLRLSSLEFQYSSIFNICLSSFQK